VITEPPYNPLDKKNLGASVAQAMLVSEVHPLTDLTKFNGAGIYAIYYAGAFACYETISNHNKDGLFKVPIYVGKAVPPGARKGGSGLGDNVAPALFKRLLEHAKSINAAHNLDLMDFHCRYLVVEDIWIPLGESLLIAMTSPIWNKVVDGFGNHTPGAGRFKQARSKWDVLHPGREWAVKCADREETPDQISREVTAFLRTAPMPRKT